MHKSGEPIIRKERLKAGRAIMLPAGGVVWLPEGYRACNLIVATPPGQTAHHIKAPDNENR